MWSVQLQNDSTADTLKIIVSMPAGPWAFVIAAIIAIGWFVFRIYLTERTKSALLKHVDLDRFKKEQRKIDEAWSEIAAAKAEHELNAEMIGRLIEERNFLREENATLRRTQNGALSPDTIRLSRGS